MKMNREQGLFLVVLLVVGGLGYLRFNDQYAPKRPPRGKGIDAVEAPSVPIVRFPTSADASYQPSGRDPFLPPRDWNPLPYLTLPWPPLPEIGAIEFVPAPGMESDRLSPLRLPPAGDVLAAPSPSGESGPAAGDGGNGGGFGGIDFGAGGAGDDLGLDVSNPERTYDWVKRKSLSRVWGTIMNPDPLKLLDDPTLAVDFRTVNPKTGQAQGRLSFPRAELEGNGGYEAGSRSSSARSGRASGTRRRRSPPRGSASAGSTTTGRRRSPERSGSSARRSRSARRTPRRGSCSAR